MQNNKFKADLNQCQTLGEIFKACENHYNLDVKLGFIAKATLLNNIDKVLILANAKLKNYA